MLAVAKEFCLDNRAIKWNINLKNRLLIACVTTSQAFIQKCGLEINIPFENYNKCTPKYQIIDVIIAEKTSSDCEKSFKLVAHWHKFDAFLTI